MNAIETRSLTLNDFDTSLDHLSEEETHEYIDNAELIEDEASDIAWDMMAELSAWDLMCFLGEAGWDVMDEMPRFRSEDDMDRWIENQKDWMTEELSHTVTIKDDGQVEIAIGLK